MANSLTINLQHILHFSWGNCWKDYKVALTEKLKTRVFNNLCEYKKWYVICIEGIEKITDASQECYIKISMLQRLMT